MDTKDILLYENGDGGEMVVLSDDLQLVETLYQQTYLALFGGNIEANTLGNELESEQRFDWWGNSLFTRNSKPEQFNSNTERELLNVVLNNSGRLAIIRAVELDLEFLSPIAETQVDVRFPAKNQINIIVKFAGKNEINLVYDNAKNEVIIFKII